VNLLGDGLTGLNDLIIGDPVAVPDGSLYRAQLRGVRPRCR